MVIPNVLKRYADKIADISDERWSGDGYWVYLKNGWINTCDEVHLIHEDNPTQCARKFADVKPCTDDCCRKG